MFFELLDINFDTRSVAIGVHTCSASQCKELREYLVSCRELGYDTLHVSSASTISTSHVENLRKMLKTLNLEQHRGNHRPRAADLMSRRTLFRFKVGVNSTDGLPSMDYTLKCVDFRDLKTTINHFVVLTSQCAGLGSLLTSRIRTCLYELTVNSIEHAVFLHPVKELQVDLSITNGRVDVRFRDNAAYFATEHSQEVTIESQIDGKRTRGLGLYMISKLSRDLGFQRLGRWNTTTFNFRREPGTVNLKKERQK